MTAQGGDLLDLAAGVVSLILLFVSIGLAGVVALWVWRSFGRNAASAGWAAAAAVVTLVIMLFVVRPMLVDKAREPVNPPYQPVQRSNSPWGQ